MLRKLLISLAALIVIAAVIAGGGAAWLLYTEAGLAWAAARIVRAAGDALVLDGARGALSTEVRVSRVRYSDGGATVEARDVALRLSPWSLVVLAPRISALHCAEIEITLADDGEPSRLPDSLALPLRVDIAEARAGKLRFNGSGRTVELSDIALGYSGSRDRHSVRDASVEVYGTRLAGRAEVGVEKPYPVSASVKAGRATAPAADATAELNGTLERLAVAVRLQSSGAHLEAEATVTPYAALPIEKLDATLAGVDLQAFEAGLPRTDLAGEIHLAAAGGELEGTVALANQLPGRYDGGRLPIVSLRAAARTDLASIELSNLNVDLGPAGGLSGSGDLARERATVSLQTSRLDLAGLHGRLRATRLAGRIEVVATGERQSATVELAERELRLALAAERAADVVTVRNVRARARGGEARGQGRLQLSGAQPFAAEARFERFDPAAWGSFPPGAVNGRVTAKGTLAGARAVEAQFDLDSSQLNGAPLAGRGRASARADRISGVHADLSLGGNRLEVRGALGGPDDLLTARVLAPQLAALHSQWAGSVDGTVQISGSFDAPGATFDLRARQLALDDWKAAALSAKGEISSRAGAPLRVEATATGLSAPPWDIEQANLDVSGTQAAHAGTLRARGANLDLVARARGSWQARGGWSGTVEEIENRGPLPVKLEAPVALEVGPGHVRVGAVAARVAEGRLDAAESRYERGRLASEGRFTGMPVSAALVLAGVPATAGGTLRVSGSWKVTSTPRWNGTVSVRRESGDIAVDNGNMVSLGLETLTLDARFVESRIEFRGAVRARVASGQVEGTLLPVGGAGTGARITAASPLAFTLGFEIARLATLSELAGTALSLDGRLRMKLAGSGTLGDPLVNGTIEGDALSIELPREGIDLRRGELRAELAGREVRVQSFSIRGSEGVLKASGTLVHGSSGKATLEWQAERLAVMSRPDRRLVVTGSGNATLEGPKVSLAGKLRADEGAIEVRAATLAEPGEDVVIVGREKTDREATRLTQTVLDLAFDFGQNFRIRGRGLDTLLAGAIRVQTEAAGNLVAKGTVRTVRGTYTAFGQKLALERGALNFAGPMDNPGLDIRAMRKMPEVEAGVEVSGSLRAPFVRVVSDPPLPENEALSWLVLGHGPGEGVGTDMSMLPLAAAALMGQEAPTTGVAQRFGLDSIGMRSAGGSGSGTTGESQFVTFGKRLSDDIYIVYEQSLGATANVLRLEYNIGRRVLLRAETGEASALGLFYRWAFD